MPQASRRVCEARALFCREALLASRKAPARADKNNVTVTALPERYCLVPTVTGPFENSGSCAQLESGPSKFEVG